MNTQQEPVTTAVTVGAILDRYERDCLDDLAPRTQIDYRRHLGHLRRRFGHLEASTLEPRTFAEYLNAVKRGRINRARELAVLSAALTIAVRRWFWLKVNVLRDVERPKSKPRDRLILDEEFEACKALAPFRIGLAMQLALLTGQRQGDIIRFKWSDLREVVIDDPDRPGHKKTITELQIQQGKTGKRLGIEVTPDLESVLDKCWQLKGSGNAGSIYILPTRTGKPFTSAGFRASWQKVRLKWERGGGEPMRFHDIRALAATKCPTLEAAQALLGHSNPAMTRRVYRRGIERVKPLRLTTPTLIEGIHREEATAIPLSPAVPRNDTSRDHHAQ
jgi:integrase